MHAANSLSYSGRLVQTSGAPVTGPVNLRAELVYTNNTSTVLCSQSLTSVALTKGVFHLKLDLNCAPKTLTQVLSETPSGESVAIRIIDQSNSKTYPLQAIHSVPFSKVAEQLPQMGASNGQALVWDGAKWAPTSVGTGNGTVMSVNTGAGLTGGPITTSGTISVAAGGITSTELAANSVTAAKINAGEITSAHISATANIPYSKLQIGVGEIPQDRINGLATSMSAMIEDVIADAVTGKAPSQNAVYDALALKADRANVTQNITAASVVGLTAPTVGSAAANRDYVDNSATTLNTRITNEASTLNTRITNEVSTINTSLGNKYDKAGGVITGDVTLNTQMLLKGGSNFVTVKANSGTANYVMTLPTTAGTNGYVLQTDGAGVLSWVNPSSVVTGSGTVNSASITDGSIVDADINASANIAQSKIAGLSISLAGKENTITGGTTAQYYRGDKTFADFGTDVRATSLSGYTVGANTALGVGDTTLGAFGKLQGQINATNSAITSLTTTNVAEGTNLYFTEPRVLGTDLLGFNNTLPGPITATDTILQAFGRTQKQINDLTLSMAGNQWTAVNSTDVYRTSGNVGVGTIPTDDPFRNVLEIGGTSDGGKLVLSDTTGDSFSFNSDQFGYLHMYNKLGGTNYHVLSTKVSKVGIGTVNPEERLQIHISSGMDKHLLLTNSTTGVANSDGHLIYLSSDDLVFNNQEASSGGKTYFRNNGADTLMISETGNVGIGTITPTEKLEVSGNIKATQVCIGTDCRSAWPTTSIAAGSVTTTEILDGTIATADIADGAVSLVKLGGARDGTKYLKGDNTWSTFATDAINSVLSSFTVDSGTKPTVTNSDSIVGAFGKVQKTLNDINADYVSKTQNQTITGTLAINSMTGFITVPTPLMPNDAVNKSYVDGLLTWIKNGSDIYFNSGKVGIGTNTPLAALDITSTTSGFLPPRMNTTQRNAIASATAGLVIYNTETSQHEFFNGSIWQSMGASGSAVSPAGLIGSFPTNACPAGWLEANGAAVSRTTYAGLFTAIGTMYGPGDGTTTFNLPDYRGYFLRGWSHGSGNDTAAATRTNRGDGIVGDNVGTKQGDAIRNITGALSGVKGATSLAYDWGFQPGNNGAFSVTNNLGTYNTYGGAYNPSGGVGTTANFDASLIVPTSTENRPKNINVIYCVSTATVAATTIASTGSGTTNTIPVWNSTTELGNSPITVSGANVGVGTTSPQAKLDVNGAVKATSFVGPGILLQAINLSAADFITNTSNTWSDVPNLTSTFTTTVPVTVDVVASGLYRTMNSAIGNIRLVINGVEVAGDYIQQAGAGTTFHTNTSINWAQSLAAGTHTIKVQWRNENATGSFDQGWNDSGRVLNRRLKVMVYSQ